MSNVDHDYKDKLEKEQQFFDFSELDLINLLDTLSIEEDAIAFASDEQIDSETRVDDILKTVKMKEESLATAEKFVDDQLFQTNKLLSELNRERCAAEERLERA